MKKQIDTFASLIASALLLGGTAAADTFEWNADADGDWTDGSKWTQTDGSSTRLYPNDPSDVAVFNLTITDDREVTLPSSEINLERIEAGNANHEWTVTGDNQLNMRGATSGTKFEVLNGGILNLDVDVSQNRNDPGLTGDGVIVVGPGSTFDRGADHVSWLMDGATLTLRVLGSVDNVTIRNGSRLEIGRDNAIEETIQTNAVGGTIASYGGDRVLDVGYDGTGPTREHSFDGSNGFNLTFNDLVSVFPGGTADFTYLVDTARFTAAGGVEFGLSNKTYAQQPMRLANGGTFEIAGPSTSAGPVHFDGSGTLLLNNTTGSATRTDDLILGRSNNTPAGTAIRLAGTGSTDSLVIITDNSLVAPGNSIGTLTVGAATFEAGSAFEWEFSGSDSDLLNVLGDLTIDDSFTLELIAFGLPPSGTADLMAFTGNFDGDPDAWTIIPPDGLRYDDIFVTDTSNGTLRITGLVPEPTTLGLVAVGAAMTLTRRRRRQ